MRAWDHLADSSLAFRSIQQRLAIFWGIGLLFEAAVRIRIVVHYPVHTAAGLVNVAAVVIIVALCVATGPLGGVRLQPGSSCRRARRGSGRGVVVSAPFGFGVYPFGLAGGPDGLAAGPPDDLGQIREMLCRLQGEGPELLARVYVGWSGPQSTQRGLGQIADLIEVGLSWDLVLAYRDPSGNVAGWGQFVAQFVARFGRHVAAVQVTGEAYLTDVPHAGDGAYPRATEAVVEGLSFAAEAKRAHGALAAVGFAVVPEDDPSAGRFWPALAARGGSRLAACVDYVGLDMYPDVFGSRVEQGQLRLDGRHHAAPVPRGCPAHRRRRGGYADPDL